MQWRGVLLAVQAGMYAATAGLTGKLAASYSEAHGLCLLAGKALMLQNIIEHQLGWCDESRVMYLRVAAFVSTLFVNALLWTVFTKALRHCASSLEAIVVTTAANMLATAVLSQVLFGETLGLLWWCGLVLVLFGLVLIRSGARADQGATPGARKLR